MKLKRVRGLVSLISLVGAELLGTVGTAHADSNGNLSIEVCANGNYTAYAKWAVPNGGQGADLSRAAQGQCVTNNITISPSLLISIYAFGIYNVSHQGFDVRPDGHPLSAAMDVDTSKILIRATGTTTDPHFTFDAWGAAGHTQFSG